MDTRNLKEGATVIYNKHAGGSIDKDLVDGEKYEFIKRVCENDINKWHVLIEKDGKIYAVEEDELRPTLRTRFTPNWLPS